MHAITGFLILLVLLQDLPHSFPSKTQRSIEDCVLGLEIMPEFCALAEARSTGEAEDRNETTNKQIERLAGMQSSRYMSFYNGGI